MVTQHNSLTGADLHVPKTHTASHTDGTDDIQDATAGQKGIATAAQITKLDGIEALADITDATNVNAAGAVMESDIPDQSFVNLLENGDFESWSAGAAAAPDGWVKHFTPVVAKETTITKVSDTSLKVTPTNINQAVSQSVVDYARYANRVVTFGCWVYATAAGAHLMITDGVVWTSGSDHTGGSTWEWLTVSITVDASPTILGTRLYPDATNGTAPAYFDGAMLVEGSVCPAFSPKPLPDDGQSIVIDSTTNQVTIDGTVMNAVEAGADVTDATNVDAAGAVMESDIKDQSFTNLLENGDFESWSAGAAANPDGWVVSGAGTTIARSADEKIGDYSAAITTSGATGFFGQWIGGADTYSGRVMTVNIWVKCATIGTVNLKLEDGVGYSNSGSNTTTDWELLTLSRTFDASATAITFSVRVLDGYTVYLDGAILVEGSVCPAFSPKPLADDGVMLHVKTPSAANAAGVQGQVCTDASYIYVCTATDTWERVAIASW